jgi:hypothetical protein
MIMMLLIQIIFWKDHAMRGMDGFSGRSAEPQAIRCISAASAVHYRMICLWIGLNPILT